MTPKLTIHLVSSSLHYSFALTHITIYKYASVSVCCVLMSNSPTRLQALEVWDQCLAGSQQILVEKKTNIS